jgi:MFS family permease
LIATLLLTGLSTFAVGFAPGYESIGIWDAVILTIVRFIQGLGIGGEWGGATLMSMEWARTDAHRGFVYVAFLFTYGTTVLHSSRDLLLSALLTATGLSAVTIPLSGYVSDRIGRKRMYLIGAVATGLFAFVYFAMMNTGVPGWIFLAVVLSFIPHDMMYGPQAALIAECFTPRLRYSGASLGYHLHRCWPAGPPR